MERMKREKKCMKNDKTPTETGQDTNSSTERETQRQIEQRKARETDDATG